ncbi:hypothetical protein MMC26_007823 [Xylographa opegraphella]|nr:hypothetical protein [Xylographa opegraphella]
MADKDLDEIRKIRLAQLQQGGGSGGGGVSGSQTEQREHQADARTSILAQILTPEAADRLGRIRLVKESRATDIESRLIMMAKSGQLRSKVSEAQLKELLGAVADDSREKDGGGNIQVTRRKGLWDDDDDDLAGCHRRS